MTYLIPLAYINEACSVSQNIDEKKMKANLEEAQADLREVLGPEFYEDILDQYENDSFTSANDTLYEDYIKNFLAWQAYFYSLGFSQSESTPTGERAFTDENSTILQDVQLYSKEKNVKRRAQRYKYDLINYLTLEQSKDSTAFPKWEQPCNEEFSFGITSVSKENNAMISINRVVKDNE